MQNQGERLFHEVKKPRASDEARSLILSLISEGRLQVGDQLPSETRMAEQMGLSRVPVREAVTSLEQFGLLTVKRGSGGGVFVAEPSLEPFGKFFSVLLKMRKASVRELTEARLLIEPGVAALAARNREPVHIDRLRQSIANYRSSLEQGRERSIQDWDFHIALAEASHNTVLEVLVKGMVPLLHKSVKDLEFDVDNRIRGIRGHERVLAAVEAADPEGAQQAMSNHVNRMATLWK
ncbi:MAG: FadR family transcriptional regulator [Deltaproteobacteria bacterium]|nr:FadR family transcriptional regulator [Deltaproteobacteria bacterium]